MVTLALLAAIYANGDSFKKWEKALLVLFFPKVCMPVTQDV